MNSKKRPIKNSIYQSQKLKAVGSFQTLERTMDVSSLNQSVSVLDGLPYYLSNYLLNNLLQHAVKAILLSLHWKGITFLIIYYIIIAIMTSNDINFIPAIKFIEEKFNMLTNEKEKKVKDKKERMNNFKKKIMGKAEEIVEKVEDIIIDETEDAISETEDAILDVAPVILVEPVLRLNEEKVEQKLIIMNNQSAPTTMYKQSPPDKKRYSTVETIIEDEAERILKIQLNDLINRSRKKPFMK